MMYLSLLSCAEKRLIGVSTIVADCGLLRKHHQQTYNAFLSIYSKNANTVYKLCAAKDDVGMLYRVLGLTEVLFSSGEK